MLFLHSPRAALLTLVALTAVALHPSLARAQRLGDGRPPRDISVEVIERPYAIRGNTVEELGLQMRAVAPGGRLTAYVYSFEWAYTGEEFTGDFQSTRSGRCRIVNLRVHFLVGVSYPHWERDGDAPTELADAWEAFDEQLVRQWEEQREGIFTFGREISRQLHRLQEACPLLQSRAQEVVARLRDASSEAAMEAAAAGERIVLRWPPER